MTLKSARVEAVLEEVIQRYPNERDNLNRWSRKALRRLKGEGDGDHSCKELEEYHRIITNNALNNTECIRVAHKALMHCFYRILNYIIDGSTH
mmetsp:Transcript_11349/g.17068  ORF Transcript_11349/g.17068 Transcript_11349/m.17068 type:complete len:93 (-) Transcript_11349:559-837(-)